MNGGKILSAQAGTRLQSYLNQFQQASVPISTSTTTAESKAPKNVIGTIGDMNAKQGILAGVETAADIAALTPGITGAIGATVSGVIDSARAWSDPNTSVLGAIGETALNLGFVAAAFLGAGAIKGLFKGAKLASDAIDATKIVKDAKAVKEFSVPTDALKSLKRSDSYVQLQKSLDNIDTFVKELPKENKPKS
jgi:hypothetical protein